jgi:ATP synthase I chain
MTESLKASMTEANSFLAFTDADLKAALRRALRTCAAMAVILFGFFAFTGGWRVGLISLGGAVVSFTGIYEWQQLIDFVNARLDNQKPPRSTARVAIMFFLRLGFAAAVVYVSLKCSRGTPYALIAGLGLAVLALTIEAVRLIRS